MAERKLQCMLHGIDVKNVEIKILKNVKNVKKRDKNKKRL